MSYDTPNVNAAEAQEPSAISFSILRRGDTQPIGPVSLDDILGMLQRDELTRHDYVYYEGLLDWELVEKVFDIQEQISHFVDDGQDRQMVALSFREVSEITAQDEQIYYIAVQHKSGLLSKGKACVILTNKRFLILHQKRSGFELEAYRWPDVSNTLMKDEGSGLGIFSVLLRLEKRIDIPHIPISQVHRLFQLSQELRDMPVSAD